MVYVEAPNLIESNLKSIFLAGSISKAADWQKELVDKISDINAVVYNPRRAVFPKDDPELAYKQIVWEHDYLKKADVISFWFSKETDAPITLFELGRWLASSKPIIVGIDPDYPRREDVEIQTMLERSMMPIVYTLNDLSDEIFKIMGQVQFVY